MNTSDWTSELFGSVLFCPSDLSRCDGLFWRSVRGMESTSRGGVIGTR